jgi:IS5 family transposase
VFDRASMTRWRRRMGEEKLTALIQESLNIATRSGAAKPADFFKVIVDTTVQPKAVAFPSDAKLMRRARGRLARLAKKHGVVLRQSYERVGKACVDRPSALRPRQTVQARQPGAADPCAHALAG